jgi:hypothetical protein
MKFTFKEIPLDYVSCNRDYVENILDAATPMWCFCGQLAYENEATITAAELIKEFLWQKILKCDLSKPLAGFVEMCEINRMNDFITYYSIMYYTHGV